jgi:GT2 family glycosyltransferase
MPDSVCVTIVTHNSSRYIARCLESVLNQQYSPLDVIVVDNGSMDSTREELRRFSRWIRVVRNERNAGFAAAQNQAIALSRSDWVLMLNPDVLLLNGFIQRLVEAGGTDPKAGTVCGKLLAIGSDFAMPGEHRIDSAGMYFTPEMRHFDRGWHTVDDGRFDNAEYVFGATAAAAMYRRRMIDDISLEDGFLDPDFFVYREDADVSWRAQLMGWRCLYEPSAVSYHVRRMVPGDRRSVPAFLNMHSVKNRFLMRVKNATGGVYKRCWLQTTLRDMVVFGGCLFYEPTSLPAFWHLAKAIPAALRKRRQIMSRRVTSDEDMARWFQPTPVAEPAPELVLQKRPV